MHLLRGMIAFAPKIVAGIIPPPRHSPRFHPTPGFMKSLLRLLLLSSLLLGSTTNVRSQAVENIPKPEDYWAIENAAERAKQPLYKTIPAAEPHELTPSNGLPPRSDYRDWYRSHGDHSGSRYSGLTQINRSNVQHLKRAWIYRSQDMPEKSAAIQTNPIIVDGIMYTPHGRS